MKTNLVILDRDGVINYDSIEFIKAPEEWQPIPGSIESIRLLKAAGFIIAVATNQSGIARGLFDEKVLKQINRRMMDAISPSNTYIDHIAYCPHGPESLCECRKPRTGMYLEISRKFSMDLTGVPVIGDSTRDLEAAVSVGARPFLVKTGKGKDTLRNNKIPPNTLIFEDLYCATQFILEDSRK